MWKLILVVPAVLFLAGCKDTVIEDNSPNRHERESAMAACVGVVLHHHVHEAEESIRLECTRAIYGGYN
jgi:hypothetical protein